MQARYHVNALFLVALAGATTAAEAQVQPELAKRYFDEAKTLCERDAGRLWGVSLCGPLVIVDQASGTRAPQGASVETGRYLVESVSLCWACHTQRSKMTGALTGPRFGGATGFIEGDDPDHTWSPPNITSDPETGRLGGLTEDGFVARFRLGRLLPGSPMPWQAFSRMDDDDLRAIYRYLKSVPPVKNDVGAPMVVVTK